MMKGIFLDGCVTGVDYRTQTMEGALDAQGMYDYREGESILFTIGDFVLGSAAAKAYMSRLILSQKARAGTDGPAIIRWVNTARISYWPLGRSAAVNVL